MIAMNSLRWLVLITVLMGQAARGQAPATPSEFESLRAAVTHLMSAYGTGYPGGESLLSAISDAESRGDLETLASLRSRALRAHPRLARHPMIFVERRQYPSDHHNTGNIFQTGEINHAKFRQMAGGALKVLNVEKGSVTTLLESEHGMPRDPEVSFDGKRIVFSMRRGPSDDYHIYEMASDGTGLRQLTEASGISDLSPFYLAGGDIAFSSTREPKYCACNRHIMANLYRMKPDGGNVLQIGKSIEFEGHGIQMPDGRLLYFRWEYVDRNFGGAQGLWVGNPDGTAHSIVYGQSTPHSILNPRPIPGTNKIVCIFSSCHDRPWGAMAILDTTLGIEGADPVVNLWPESSRRLIAGEKQGYGGSAGFDNFKQVALKYEDPFPLDQDFFLVSRVLKKGSEEVGVFLVDTFGNSTCLQRPRPGFGCYDPMILAPSPTPRQLPTRRDYSQSAGQFYVSNVYEGTHMKGVQPGSIKYLRVIENPPKLTWTHPSWAGQGTEAPAMNWHDFDNKRIIGDVDVESDGSVYFSVPSERFVYFQLLDDRHRMVQSMRSGVIVQSGETASCVGCHDSREGAPKTAAHTGSAALRKAPQSPRPWFGAARNFGFVAEVQPVLDRHCIKCHDFGAPNEKALNLSGDKTLVFNVAYMELHRRRLVNVIGGGPNKILGANSWGSRQSRLMQVLEKGHYDVSLSDEDFQRLNTWIDLNAPYYSDFPSAHEKGIAGRAPLSGKELDTLKRLTARNIHIGHGAGPMINLQRPEFSPILRGLKAKKPAAYQSALALIRTAAARLVKTPRQDMPGFIPCETDRLRLAKYDRLREHQLRVRRALRENTVIYDRDL